MPHARPREVFGPNDGPALLAEIPQLGTDAPREATDRALPPHTHPGAFEICLITRGQVAWWAGQTIYEVGAGSLYLTRPGEPHGGVDAVLHPCTLYWLTLRLPEDHPLPEMNRAGAARLARFFHHELAARTFPASPLIETCFQALLDEHRAPDALSIPAARGWLHELLVRLWRDHESHHASEEARRRRVSEPVRRAQAWMESHLEEPVGIAQAAREAGLGVSRFHERFRRETGFTPAEWRTRRRVERTKALLRSSRRPITEIALATGFKTSQYFATTFKRVVGLTPRAYRAKARRR